MTLVDSGPLVALMDRRDPHHGACTRALPSLSGPLVTTWACMVEALHILNSRGGWRAQSPLLKWAGDGRPQIDSVESGEIQRVTDLMAKYADVPMDFADACLVVLAERLGSDLIFTIDSDFRVYRWKGRRSFRLTP